MIARTGLGLRAQKGGAVAVAVVLEGGKPRVVSSTLLATHAEGDRLSLEPYRVAHGLGQGRAAEAADAVAEGRARQDRLAEAGLRAIVDGPFVAALLVNRAGWVTNLLDYSLAWPDHVPVAEGLAVREALRTGLRACGVETLELDEKSLPERAAERLGLASAEIDARLKALGKAVGGPWRKEQKLACLAGWIAALG
ncbi:hypothetical protein [Sphingomonas sp.]|uniref:hypothetical protein n=1 Tax=Sphingomonas sp. TaxID=28214 RepID=UPI001B27243D|nr:hypothetical protein [Sphingomonas sp.]MBO9714759.1 hypothetical protein [Sphingomonas sp.]